MQPSFKPRATAFILTPAVLALLLAGCGNVKTQANALEASATKNFTDEQEKASRPVPVISTTAASWIMGQPVQVAPTPSPLLTRIVAYHPTQRVALSEVAAWISQSTGMIVDTAEVQGGAAGQSAPAGVPSSSAPLMPPLPALMGVGGNAVAPQSGMSLLSINYEGPLSGLLDIAANKAGVWWKFTDGRLIFYRTQTRTFYLPAIVRKSFGSSLISTASGGTGGSSSGGSSSSSSSSSGTLSVGATNTSEYQVDVWGELEKTAKTIGGGAQIATNASMGSLTVTGTPTQVRNVEEWAKTLSDNLSQQVALTVHIYNIKVTNEDSYSWNPSVVFNSLSSKYGFTLAGPQAPPVLSGLKPLNLAANVLKTATGSAAQWSGSQLAVQALSTLGHVTETLQQTIVTLNGQPAPIQVANQLSYLQSTTPGAQTTIGAAPVPPTLTPGQVTTGFTGMFLPRIVNGKILLAINLTNSRLVTMGTVGSGGATIQVPNVDISTFQQSVTLTPGDSLLLTGLQQDTGNTNQSGIGLASNYLLGGGEDNSKGKQLIAIVITAKVL